MIIFNKTTCPNCGGPLKIFKDDNIATCSCCNTDYILEETHDAHLLTEKYKPKPLIVKEKREKRSLIISNLIWIRLICLLIGIALLVTGIYFAYTCYFEYHIMLDNGEVICTKLYKCDTKFGNNFYNFKLAKTDNIEIINSRLYLVHNDITYELCIASMTEKTDGYIYLDAIPYFCVSTESYSVKLNTIRANKQKYTFGIILGILGLFILAPSFAGVIKSLKLE